MTNRAIPHIIVSVVAAACLCACPADNNDTKKPPSNSDGADADDSTTRAVADPEAPKPET